MQSLVLGATGVVGRRIVDQLLKQGEKPFAFSRSPPNETRDVRWFSGNLLTPEVLKLPSFSVLYCTAHAELLAKALPSLASPELKRVVLFTSTSIITKLDSEIAEERDGLQRLAEGEHNVISACKNLNIAYTVLRPTIIYDEGRDVNVTRLARFIRRFGVMILTGNGAGLRQPVHAADLASGAFDAAHSAAAADKIYSLPGAETITYREMVGRIFDGLRKPRRIFSVHVLLWKTAFSLASPFLPNANVAMGKRMSKDMVFDASPAKQDFGWSPRAFQPNFIDTNI